MLKKMYLHLDITENQKNSIKYKSLFPLYAMVAFA